MAKRQNTTPENVMRIDGEGKVHANGGKVNPLCKFRGNEDHTWVLTDDAVDCGLCITRGAKREEARKRTAYAANVAESQDADMQHATPRVVDAPPVVPAETPVIAENGETVTVPVDYADESKGRRELDASKGERILSEDDMTALLRKVRERLASEKSLNTDQWAEVVTQAALDSHFGVTLHEPKNGECPGVEIPPLPEGVHPHTWELAHDGNTQGARDYHMRQAKAQEAAYAAENNKGDDVPPF
jgi:hypothetical protein